MLNTANTANNRGQTTVFYQNSTRKTVVCPLFASLQELNAV